jgi:hypothetical protein
MSTITDAPRMEIRNMEGYILTMRKPRQLKVVAPKDTKLGRPTIMDRALAQRYGAPYVHLAAFAIDVDRVHQGSEHELPFAWEVFLTELQIRQVMETAHKDPAPMLEEMCLGILELPRPKHGDTAALGSQLTFAVYTALARGFVATELGHCFSIWRKPPVELVDEMNELEKDPAMTARLVDHCLNAELDPPLVTPVREALLLLRGR